MNTSLTDAVLTYRRTRQNWSEVSDRITLYVYEFPRRWTDWDEDRCSDFFMAFLPRIKGLVERYFPAYPFETYLISSLKWYLRTYTENRAKQEHYEAWTESESVEKLQEHLDENQDFFAKEKSEYPFELNEKGCLKDATLRRRILYVVLLKAAEIDDALIPEIADLVDVDSNWLYEIIVKARSIVADKIEKREHLRQRRNEYWYRMEGAKRRLRTDGSFDPESRRKWERRTSTWQRRYETACNGIRKTDLTVAHHHIGKLLDTPPGTVSSGLFFLRKLWKTMESKETREAHHRQSRRSPWTPSSSKG